MIHFSNISLQLYISFFVLLVVLGCALDTTVPTDGKISGSDRININSAINLQLSQNGLIQQELDPGNSSFQNLQVVVVSEPQNGEVVFNGTSLEYRTSDPGFTGTDQLIYYLAEEDVASSVGIVNFTVESLTAGAYDFFETYSGQSFQLDGWQSYASTFGHVTSPSYGFGSGTYDGGGTDYRDLSVFVQSGDYGGDSLYNSLFGNLPVDGSGGGMNDWPWSADLIHIPECAYEVELTAKVTYKTISPLFNMLLNYRIDNKNSLSGYMVLVNPGANGMILHMFDNVDERATAYLDRWPGHPVEGSANPVTYAAGKAWDRDVGAFPAGGAVNAGLNNDVFIAVKYSYDPISGQTTIGYESRHDDGTDDTPGSYDVERVLSGADSLAPGGDFGIMPTTYHNSSGTHNHSNLHISELEFNCVFP